MSDADYLAYRLGETFGQMLSHQVVSAWEESSCPMECGQVGQVFFFVHGDGGMTSRCMGCRRDSYLSGTFEWVYSDIGGEFGEPWALIAR